MIEYTPQSARDKFTKLLPLIPRELKEEEKNILKLPHLAWRRVLSKNWRALSNREKLNKNLKLGPLCTAWWRTPKNLVKINSSTMLKDCKRPGQKSKIVLKLLLNARFEQSKEHYQTEKSCGKALNMVVGALLRQPRPNICLRSIHQILSADFRSH